MKISNLYLTLVFFKVCGLSNQDCSKGGNNLSDVNFNTTNQNYNPVCPISSRSAPKENLQNVEKSRTRIIGGKIANIKDFPFVAAIIMRYTKKHNRKQLHKENDYLKALINKQKRVLEKINCIKRCNERKPCIKKLCSNKKYYNKRNKRGYNKRDARKSNDEYFLFCGGATIVGKNWLLTAAHVVADMEKKQAVEKGRAFVFSNSANWKNNYTRHRILQINIHEKYEKNIMNNDIAVIKVDEPFTGKHEKLIPFAYPSYKYKSNTKVTALGWGLTASPTSRIEVQLRYVKLNLVNFETCKNLYGHLGSTITNHMFCAIAPGKDTCAGDSGGPLVQGRTLIGIVSKGPPDHSCGKRGIPGVYAKVSRFVYWLQDKMNL